MLVRDVLQPVADEYGLDLSKYDDSDLDRPVTISRPSWSASLLKKREECNRHAWFKWAERVEIEDDGEESPFLKRGSDLHTAIEDYLNGKTKRPMDGLACANMDRIDEYKALVDQGKAAVENWISLDLGTLGTFRGKLDVDHWKGFVDHKTTSKPERILSPNVLKRDIQCMGYAQEKFSRTDFDEIDVTYDYYLTRGRANCTTVNFKVTREEAQEFWNTKIIPAIMDAYIDFQKEDATVVAADDTSCRWCPYKDHCTIHLENVVKTNTPKVPAQREIVNKTYVKKESTMAFDKNAFLAKVKAKKEESEPVETNAGDQPDNDDPTPKLPGTGREVTELDELGLTPTMVGALNELGVDTPDEAALLVDEQLLEVNGFGPKTLEDFRKIFPNPVKEDEEPEPTEDEEKTPAWKQKEEPEPEEEKETQAPVKEDRPDGKVCLYVDCVPSSGGKPLSRIKAFIDATDFIAEQNKVPHYTCVEYGKGPGEVAARYYLSGDWKHRTLLLDSRSAVDRLILERLSSHATVLVRGLVR